MLGQNTRDNVVDVDLSLNQAGRKVSRRHVSKYNSFEDFHNSVLCIVCDSTEARSAVLFNELWCKFLHKYY